MLRSLLILSATLAAFALRVPGIADKGGLDWDEAFSAALASLPPLEIVRYCLSALQEHPPLFYLLLHWWIAVAGDSEAALRMSAVVPSTLAVPVVGAATALVAGTPAGAIAAWVLALAPLDVFYGRFTRMYALLTLYVAILLAAAAVMGRRGPRHATGSPLAAAAVVLTVATHYFLAFAVLAPALLLATGRAGRRLVAGATVIGTALIGVWLAASPGLRDTFVLRVGPRLVEVGELANTELSSLGAIMWPFGNVVAGGVVLVAIVLAMLVQWGRLPMPFRGVAVAAFLVPVMGVPLLTLLRITYAPRYIVMAMPAAAVLAGLALRHLPPWGLVPVGALGGWFALQAVLPNYTHRWGDYPAAVAALRERARPDDGVVLNGPVQSMWYQRYASDLPEGRSLIEPEGSAPSQLFAARVSGKGLSEREANQGLGEIAAIHPRVWDVESGIGYQDPTDFVLHWLDQRAYPVYDLHFSNAVLRLYFTDGGGKPPTQARPVDQILLDMHVERVALDRWQLEPGAESRIQVVGRRVGGAGQLKASVRLVPDGGGKSVWEQDRPLLEEAGRLEMRGGVQVPKDTAPGTYGLHVVVYQTEAAQGAGAGRIPRSSDAVRIAEVAVAIPSPIAMGEGSG